MDTVVNLSYEKNGDRIEDNDVSNETILPNNPNKS
jgi:hypothetical protein